LFQLFLYRLHRLQSLRRKRHTRRLLRGRDIAPARTGMPQLTIKGQALSGSTGCNSFTSTLTRQSDAKVHIDRPALTRKFCGGKHQGVENAFVDALDGKTLGEAGLYVLELQRLQTFRR
jgi:heat shock protein HslJ